jgi:hypothetical protein
LEQPFIHTKLDTDMTEWINMFKKILNALVDQPFLTSLFVADFSILLLHKPPFFFSLIMLGGLMAMCMYFGQKLALFKL